MTLVSLERIKNYIQTQINPYGEPFKGTAYEFGIKLLDYLNNKDADYDVDKVVEQLEDEQDYAYADFDRYAEEKGLDKEQDFFSEGMKRAIEIVKGGGIGGNTNT